MKKFKIFGNLFLTMLSCFILGAYASSSFIYKEPIEAYRWIITIMFGIFF